MDGGRPAKDANIGDLAKVMRKQEGVERLGDVVAWSTVSDRVKS